MSTCAPVPAVASPQPAASFLAGGRPGLRRWAAVAAVLLSLWLLSPALYPAHVEAFSARSHSLAIMDLRGNVALDDQAYPVNIEYFYNLRLGTVAALAAIMRVTHSTGDIPFHLLTTGSFLLLLGSCFAFVRRWSPSPLWAAFLFAVVTPGLVEIGFFFSDNLPSAALATLATALIGRRGRAWTALLAGILIAAATLCRSDGLFAAPGVLLLLALGAGGRMRRILAELAAFAVGASAVFLLAFRTTGVSLWHILQVSRWIGSMHFAGADSLFLVHASVTIFFGLPSLLLLLAGAVSLWPGQSRAERLVLTVYPALLYAYFATKAIEPRNFLLLGAPFLVLHGAAGMRVFADALFGPAGRARSLALGAAAVCLLYWLLPPRISISDGPRAIVGRLWSPPLWRQWQQTIEADGRAYDALVQSVHAGERLLVVGVSFQAERYLHLHLLEQGFDLEPHSGRTSFGNVTDLYRRDGREVLVVRNEQPFAIFTARYPGMSFRYPQEFQLATDLAAIPPEAYDRAVMLTWGDQYFFQEHVGRSAQFARWAGPQAESIPGPGVPAMRRGLYGKLRIIPLSRTDVDELERLALAEMAEEERGAPFPALRSYAWLQQVLGCRYCKP